jgi:hypothetical protein
MNYIDKIVVKLLEKHDLYSRLIDPQRIRMMDNTACSVYIYYYETRMIFSIHRALLLDDDTFSVVNADRHIKIDVYYADPNFMPKLIETISMIAKEKVPDDLLPLL